MLIHRDRPKQRASKGPKPRLKAAQLPYYRVHHHDLDTYLATVYGMRGWKFCKTGIASAGVVAEFTVDGKLPEAWETRNKINRIRAGHYTSDVTLILNLLCHDGFIPRGWYQIDTHPRRSPIQEYRALLAQHNDPWNQACIAFRDRHRNDRKFIQEAARLDRTITEWLDEQQK